MSGDQSLTGVTNHVRSLLEERQEQSFVIANLYGVLRHYFSITRQLSKLLTRKLRKKDGEIECLLLAALYQVYFMNVPLHATVSENVEAARLLKKPWACNLVNAILRSAIRQNNNLKLTDESELFEHPHWFIKQCRNDWPKYWEKILKANNEHPPFTIRVNPKFSSRNAYMRELKVHQRLSSEAKFSKQGVHLEPATTTVLPSFEEGAFTVQDEAAQLAVDLLRLDSAKNILDLCAAPGGKTTQILEQVQKGTRVTAVDNHSGRIEKLNENLSRLRLHCNVLNADAKDPSSWWDGLQFDRILLDAPCSSSGVIRRHPDIKIRRKENEISSLNREQTKILEKSWPLLAVNGIFLYVTCSIFRDENDRLIKKFMERKKDAMIDPIGEKWGHQLFYGSQVLPGESNMDGFYFCRIVKK